jgi:serine protease Do
MKKGLVLSIFCTVLLIATGGVSFYFLQKHFQDLSVQASSQLGREVPKNNSEETEKDLKTIIHENQKKVVQLEVEGINGSTTGSGFLYNDKGDIVTNAHVVAGADNIVVKTTDAKKFQGSVIGIGETIDIAVVRVSDLAEQVPVEVAKDRKAEIGDEVIALGSPLGYQNTVTTGIISGLDRDLNIEPYHYENLYQTSAPITNGNSGGPLLDRKTGELIGINSAVADSGTIGFSIPISNVYDQIVDWSENPMDISSGNYADSDSGEAFHYQMADNAFKEEAEYLIAYLYENLAMGDYVTAYSLLGSSWKNDMNYEKFREGYIYTLDISVNHLSSSLVDGDDLVHVTAMIVAVERSNDRDRHAVLYKCTYTVGIENDQMKIINGQAEEVQ